MYPTKWAGHCCTIRVRVCSSQAEPAMLRGLRRLAIGAALLMVVARGAMAGQSCEERPVGAATVHRALTLAHKARLILDASSAEIALIARAGQNLTRYGVRYSHFGFAWRDHPKGRWLIAHELNQCGTAISDIYDEGLGNFFLDDLWKMEAAILIPNVATQRRIAAALKSRIHLALHEARYNMTAYPFSVKYQNSNQWALEVIAAAEARDTVIVTRAQAQKWLALTDYQPTELKLDTITRLGARLAKTNVAFDDHPGELRWSDRIRTVTVDSVFNFIAMRDPEAVRFEVTDSSGNH